VKVWSYRRETVVGSFFFACAKLREENLQGFNKGRGEVLGRVRMKNGKVPERVAECPCRQKGGRELGEKRGLGEKINKAYRNFACKPLLSMARPA